MRLIGAPFMFGAEPLFQTIAPEDDEGIEPADVEGAMGKSAPCRVGDGGPEVRACPRPGCLDTRVGAVEVVS